jgi:hypothetical protein
VPTAEHGDHVEAQTLVGQLLLRAGQGAPLVRQVGMLLMGVHGFSSMAVLVS